MKTINFAVLLLATTTALLMAGCASVTTRAPLSAESKPIDQEKFEGTWLCNTESITVKFTSNGVARIAGVDWKDDTFRLEQAEAIVTKGKEHNFLSVRCQEDGQWPDKYYFVQYAFSDQGDLLLWLPNTTPFEEAVRSNRLQGIVNKGTYSSDIILTNEPGTLLEFVDHPENLRLFNYTKPMVLRKIAGQEKAGQP